MTKVFDVQIRQKAGTGVARAVRRQDMVPGIVYGNKQEPVKVSVQAKDILLEYTTKRFFSTLYQLNLEGKMVDVLVKDVQLHPVTDRALHIDFLRVDRNADISVAVPVRYINEDKSPSLKRGGMLNVVIHELQLKCPPQLIPAEIIVDLTGAESHKSIVLDDINLPEGVKAANPQRDHVLATIVAASDEDAAE